MLNLVNINPPDLCPNLADNHPIALLDHNESGQSIADLHRYQIRYVIDHHKLGDLTTFEPAYIRLQPVGSTCTLLFLMYQELGLLPPKHFATLMAGAIISDTLNLNSPTATHTDKTVLQKLCEIADITDVSDFAKQLFNAKSDVSHLTSEQLLTTDYKHFTFITKNDIGYHNKKWGISCIETVNPEQIFERITDLQATINKVKQQDHLDFLLVVIVDILQQQSWAICTDDEQNHIIYQSFNLNKTQNNLHQQVISLGQIVSRKKQIVPALERFYQG